MSDPRLLLLNRSSPGSGQWLGKALRRVVDQCQDDPRAETNGEELKDHLLEAYTLPIERSRYLFLVAVNESDIIGHCIARIDIGYEGRRNCLIGFLALDRGHHWKQIIDQGRDLVSDFARLHQCEEVRAAVFSQAHARLYARALYGALEPKQLVLARRLNHADSDGETGKALGRFLRGWRRDQHHVG